MYIKDRVTQIVQGMSSTNSTGYTKHNGDSSRANSKKAVVITLSRVWVDMPHRFGAAGPSWAGPVSTVIVLCPAGTTMAGHGHRISKQWVSVTAREHGGAVLHFVIGAASLI